MNIKTLENNYLLAKQRYYEGNPLMSDYEFDLLEEQLKSANSHVVNIVGSQNLKDAKFHHASPMLSLTKIQVHHNIDFPITDFLHWFNTNAKDKKVKLEGTPKFDGSSCNLIYENGKLEWALTRGDKEKGQNIIDKMKLIVPSKISTNEKTEIRGEVVIPFDVFERKYSKDYKNPRNFVAGILGRDEINEEIIKDFQFVSFEARNHTSTMVHIESSNQFLKDNGFITPPIVELFDAKDFQSIYNKFYEFRKTSPYPLDGIVIKFPESIRTSIGETTHHPKWAIAIKFPPLESITTIKSITWNIGFTGEFTPVGNLEPIDLDGTTVSNVSLYNYGNVINNGLFPGAKVIIVKSGDIIPIVQKIIEPNFTQTENCIPTTCSTPECNIIVEGDIHLVCNNPNCKSKKLNKLTRGINAFGFRSVAGATITKLFNAGFESILDIFDNSKFTEDQLVSSGEFKKGKQLNILIESRNNPTGKITLPVVISSLGFGSIGGSTAKQIAKLFQNEQPDFSGLSYAGYSPFLNKQSEEYQLVLKFIDLLNANGFKIQTEEKIQILADTIKYELTGSPKDFGFTKKEDFVNLLKEHNYAHTGLDKSTSILITDDLNSSSSKMAKAKKLGVEIMTYDQVLNLIKNKLKA
jgi:DNA ligase (NAD+)